MYEIPSSSNNASMLNAWVFQEQGPFFAQVLVFRKPRARFGVQQPAVVCRRNFWSTLQMQQANSGRPLACHGSCETWVIEWRNFCARSVPRLKKWAKRSTNPAREDVESSEASNADRTRSSGRSRLFYLSHTAKRMLNRPELCMHRGRRAQLTFNVVAEVVVESAEAIFCECGFIEPHLVFSV